MADPRKEIARALSADEWAQRHLGIVAHARDVADTAVAALEAAGFVLLPPGGEVSTHWGVGEIFHNNVEIYYIESVARRRAGRLMPLLRRSVTTWPDGSEFIGPWSPVVSDNSEKEGDGDAG